VHLAQVNVARLRHPIDHPATADFVAGLVPVNAVADASPGFVWRLQTDDGDATALRVFPDPEVIVNLSVWTSVEALRAFIYRSDHTAFLRRRGEWFDRMSTPSVALWWVPADHLPDIAEARARLDFLVANGPTPYAFGLRTLERPLLFECTDLAQPDVNALIAELDHELAATYPAEVTDGPGVLLLGRLDGRPVACGALRVLSGEWPEPTAELERMYVRPSARGRGVGAAMVAALLDEARRLGVHRVVLGTGMRQGAALALYRRLGFTEMRCWGHDAAGPLSVCLTRAVEHTADREPFAPSVRTEP
jgi:GNAT superfamily N-acetyltransferase